MSSSIEAAFQLALGDFSLDVELKVPGRGVTALFGHSGSGKTTLLRCIAGLERATDGLLSVNGEVWQGGRRFLPVHKRPIGYVFQEASLFPHLDVRRNLQYGWKRVPAALRHVAFDQAVELLGIEPLLDRAPARLSGGERQRVAIARALLTAPKLLLMDEPLSALDEASKREILPYLERLHHELEIPLLYVSHSLKEVAQLADHMVWMEGGRARAAGPLNEVLARFDLEAGEAEEGGVVLSAVVAEHDERDHLTAVDTPCGRLWLGRAQAEPGDRVQVRLPARDMSLSLGPDADSSILNVWPVVVEAIAEAGPSQVLVRMRARQTPQHTPQGPYLLARITRRSLRNLALEPGKPIYARIKSVALME